MNNQMRIEEALHNLYGDGCTVIKQRAVSGGDINQAYVLDFSNGEQIFMKANSRANIDFFRAEKEGLQAIRNTETARVPEVFAMGEEDSFAFLLLSCIPEGRKSRSSSAELGRMLASMHLADAAPFVLNGKFGFLHDNYIGAGKQINTPEESWTTFFVNRRLIPQYEKASGWFGKEDHKEFDSFVDRLDQILIEPEKPSLLHGDLWGGNYMIDQEGKPWLIDPAVYVGHREADLAMTELFGGFDPAFYEAYRETAGIDPGYKDRRDIYNLYHLLNHLNLFGGSYLHSVQAVIHRYS